MCYLLSRRVVCFIAGVVLASLSFTASASAQKMMVGKLRDKPDDWFTTDESRQLISNIVAAQTQYGGWYKGYDVTHPPTTEPSGTMGPTERGWTVPTIDNGCTYTELRLLAKAHEFAKREDVVGPFNRGVDYLMSMQYPNGGWPQRFPLQENYGHDITLNDDAMVNVMQFLREVAEGKSPFEFVDAERRAKAKAAFDRGVECLVKMQVKSNGVLTVWCQQHDPKTLAPAPARAFELVSLTGDESAGVTRLLMTIPDPSDDVKRAIHAAAAWYDRSKILGIRTEKRPDPQMPHGGDVVVVNDPSALPIWARFYEIETNRPFFSGRDGVRHYSLAEIEPERRSGYAWLRPWGTPLLNDYAKWCARFGETSVVPPDSKLSTTLPTTTSAAQ